MPFSSRPGRRRLLAAAALALYALTACTACGSADGTRRAAVPTATARTTAVPTGATPVATPGPVSCPQTTASTLGGIAARIYHEATSGGIVGQAVHRLQSSSALARAAAAGNATTTRAALSSLLAGQIVRVEILRGGKVLASAGSGAAIAPVTGTLPGGARFVVSTQSAHAYQQVTRQVTGAEVVLLSGARDLAGTISLPAGTAVPSSGPLRVGAREYQVASIQASRFPSGALRVALLVAAKDVGACPADPAQARAAVLGRVGERIYEEEQSSGYVSTTVRRMESDAAFRSAVATRNPAATRRAIVGFFAAHIHVVRVRVTVAGKLLYDLGGPHVLAPVAGTLREGGKVIGRFQMAIQDDAGYLRLAHLFTGGEVLMRTAAGQVEGTLRPGPASVPDRGPVSWRGRTYQAYSFVGTAFPSGRLRISLLF